MRAMMIEKHILSLAVAVALALSAASVQAAPETRHKRAEGSAAKTLKLADRHKYRSDTRRNKQPRQRHERSRSQRKGARVHTYPRRPTRYDYAYGNRHKSYRRGGQRYYGWRPKRGAHPSAKIVIGRSYGYWPYSYSPYGYSPYRYGRYRGNFAAYHFLAFSALTLRTFHYLNHRQRQAHDAAQIRASDAAVGETITWSDGTATGSVTVLRDGDSSAGRYCREFQQTVTIAGKSTQATGVACRQSDGAWEIISTR